MPTHLSVVEDDDDPRNSWVTDDEGSSRPVILRAKKRPRGQADPTNPVPTRYTPAEQNAISRVVQAKNSPFKTNSEFIASAVRLYLRDWFKYLDSLGELDMEPMMEIEAANRLSDWESQKRGVDDRKAFLDSGAVKSTREKEQFIEELDEHYSRLSYENLRVSMLELRTKVVEMLGE